MAEVYAIAMSKIETKIELIHTSVVITLETLDEYAAQVLYDDIVERTRAGQMVQVELHKGIQR